MPDTKGQHAGGFHSSAICGTGKSIETEGLAVAGGWGDGKQRVNPNEHEGYFGGEENNSGSRQW